MKILVAKLTKEESVIVIEDNSGQKNEVVIEEVKFGHQWTNFDEWDITDDEYGALEEFTRGVSDLMPQLNQ